MLKNWDYINSKFKNYETLSVVPGFQKNSLEPYAFIARHSDPKGLFQVLQEDTTRYFLTLTTQPIRVFKEINEE